LELSLDNRSAETESRAVAASYRFAEAMAAWLRRCTEAVVRARMLTPGHRAGGR
jgi:hypothetical protein